MVDREELKDIIHEEKLKVLRKEVEAKRKINKAERLEREDMLREPTEHLTITGKYVKVTQTDIARVINPPRSKILDMIDTNDKLVDAHALGYLHGLYVRVASIALLWGVYVWL